MPAADHEEEAQAAISLSRAASSDTIHGLVVHRVVRAGPVVETLLHTVRTLAADLVVMSSRGQGALSPWGLGSVAAAVGREAAVPVLVLGRSTVASDGLAAVGRRVRALVPLDGSSHAEMALAPAASVVAALSVPSAGALHLAGVAKSPTAVEEAEHYLHDMAHALQAGMLAGLNLEITWSVEVHSEVAEALIQCAEQGSNGSAERCDLIAMAPHGDGGPQPWALGSVTERVLVRTQLPMMLVRPTRVAAKQMAALRSRDEPVETYARRVLQLISA
jgi:nucleotide-binding universal stress UspA family protein